MIRRSYKESAPHYFCEFPGCCTPITGNITNPFCDEHEDTVAKSFWRRESENKSSTIYEQAVDKFLELCNYEKIWLEYLRMGTFEREKFLRKSGINPKLFFKQTYLFAPPFFDFSWMEIPYDQGDEDSE